MDASIYKIVNTSYQILITVRTTRYDRWLWLEVQRERFFQSRNSFFPRRTIVSNVSFLALSYEETY